MEEKVKEVIDKGEVIYTNIDNIVLPETINDLEEDNKLLSIYRQDLSNWRVYKNDFIRTYRRQLEDEQVELLREEERRIEDKYEDKENKVYNKGSLIETDELVKAYTNLLIIQYHNKPKLKQTLMEIIYPYCKLTNVIPDFTDRLYSIEKSVGDQLDIIGKYIGVDRNINIPLENHQQAIYQMEDELYRTIIKLKIIKNNTNNTDIDIEEKIFDFFQGNMIYVSNTDMTIDYILLGDFSQDIKKILSLDKIKYLPKPTGVRINIVIIIPKEFIFGFSLNGNTESTWICGFSTNNEVVDGDFLSNESVI